MPCTFDRGRETVYIIEYEKDLSVSSVFLLHIFPLSGGGVRGVDGADGVCYGKWRKYGHLRHL